MNARILAAIHDDVLLSLAYDLYRESRLRFVLAILASAVTVVVAWAFVVLVVLAFGDVR